MEVVQTIVVALVGFGLVFWVAYLGQAFANRMALRRLAAAPVLPPSQDPARKATSDRVGHDVCTAIESVARGCANLVVVGQVPVLGPNGVGGIQILVLDGATWDKVFRPALVAASGGK